MVVGRTSNFVEGFKTFTVDDELMLANLKQALHYSADNLAIPDSNLKMPSRNNANKTIPNNTSSDSNMYPVTTMPLNLDMAPITTTANTIRSQIPTTTQSGENLMPPTVPMTTRSANESFKNVKQVMNKSNLNSEDDMDDDDAVLDEEEYPNEFEDKQKSNKDDENIEEEDDEDRQYNELKRKSQTRRQHQAKESIEGFHGSVEIEGRTLKNVLLALLLSFIGYLVVYTSVNNFLPITEISPQLKKFKHLVYGGVFFILAYICLEVF